MFPANSATIYKQLRGILSRGSELYSSYFLLPEKILFHYAMAENIVVYTSWQAELLQVGFPHPNWWPSSRPESLHPSDAGERDVVGHINQIFGPKAVPDVA